MLYHGNVREDGRVINPNEMVFDNFVLNKDTGEIEFPQKIYISHWIRIQ